MVASGSCAHDDEQDIVGPRQYREPRMPLRVRWAGSEPASR